MAMNGLLKVSVGLVSLFAGLTVATGTPAAEKQEYSVAGEYVEGCSCAAVCPCELTGIKMGCLGVGAMKLTSGTYMGVDLTDAKIAYATMPGKWVRIYVDAKNPAQAKAARAFGSSVYKDWGKIERVSSAKIAFGGADGKYNVAVNGGATMRLTTVPVLGADNKTAVTHSNVKDTLNTTFYQGKTITSTYHDGARSISLKGTNSFFNSQMQSSGKI